MTLISILVYTLVILLASVTTSILIKSKIKGKKAILSYILVGLITLFSLYLTVFNFMLNKPTENKTNSANTKVENVLPNRTDETKENFSKEGALEAATNMLKSFYADPSNKLSIDDRIKGIDKDKKLDSYISDSAKSYLYLKDFMDKEEGYTTSAMAILAIIKNLTEIGNENLNPVRNDTQYVYLDVLVELYLWNWFMLMGNGNYLHTLYYNQFNWQMLKQLKIHNKIKKENKP